MEHYRLRHATKDKRRKVLLALSYGLSSMTLLDLIDHQLEWQRKSRNGLSGFDLHVLAVAPSSIDPAVQHDSARIDAVRQHYPLHTYSEIPFSSIFQFDKDIGSFMAQYAGPEFAEDGSRSDEERLEAFRSALSTATSRADMDEVLLQRLICAFAESQGCEGILWGHSDSRLAAKTLAQVAKGRGFSLPWTTSDGVSPSGIRFTFPLRHILRKELDQYAECALSDDVRSVIVPDTPSAENKSSRNMSIDALLTQYVHAQGEKYRGVMSNIARTVDKLQVLPEDASLVCVCCGMPMSRVADVTPSPTLGQTCCGCSRTLFDLKTNGAA
jgi:cytoplasmic tRNA 2-thiolation protein 2